MWYLIGEVEDGEWKDNLYVGIVEEEVEFVVEIGDVIEEIVEDVVFVVD